MCVSTIKIKGGVMGEKTIAELRYKELLKTLQARTLNKEESEELKEMMKKEEKPKKNNFFMEGGFCFC